MALKKTMTLENGVVVTYHRVTTLHIVTNIQNIIEVTSYTDDKKRFEETEAQKNGELYDVFTNTHILSVPYDQGMTIEGAYEYLKTLPEFEGSEDV